MKSLCGLLQIFAVDGAPSLCMTATATEDDVKEMKDCLGFKDDEVRLIHDSVKGSKHHCWFYVAITVMSVSLKFNWNETVGCIPISTLVCYVVYQILHTLGRVTISTNVCVHIHFIL